MKLLPPGVLTCSSPLRSCPGCGRLSKDSVCGYCRRQIPLVQAWIMERCGRNASGQSYPQLAVSLKRLGVADSMTRTAFLVLVIDGRLAEVRV